MALNRTSDSLSKCDPSLYSSIYDVRKRPGVQSNPVTAPRPVHKDTIEISRDKLQEEALNRLRHTSKIVVATNSFMRVGKYLFMAVAFPPYLLLYELPKWVIVEALPALFSVLMTVWIKVQNKTKGTLEKGAHLGQQMLRNTQKTVQAFILPIIRLAFEFRRGIRRLFDQGYQRFVKLKEAAKGGVFGPQKLIGQGVKRLQNAYEQIKEKLMKNAQQLTEKFMEGIQWVKLAPVPFLAWGEGVLQRLKDQAIYAGTPVLQKWRNSQQLAKKGTEWVSEQFEKGMGCIKWALKPIGAFYQGRMLPLFRRTALTFQRKWQQTREYFQQKHQKATAFLEQKQLRLKQLSYDHLLNRLMCQNWLPSKLKAWILRWFSHPIVKAVCKIGIRLYVFLSHSYLKSLKLVLKGISQGVQRFELVSSILSHYTSALFLKTLSGFETSLFLCRKALKVVLYYCLLYSIMGAIVLARSVQAFGSIMQGVLRQMVNVMKQTAAPLKTTNRS